MKQLFHIFSISWILCTIFWNILPFPKEVIIINGLACLAYSVWYFLFYVIPAIKKNISLK